MDQSKNIPPRSKVEGTLTVPGSKSYAQRALALSALSKSKVTLHQLTECDDVSAALGVIKVLGSTVSYEGDQVQIIGSFEPNRNYAINCGEAGLSTRLFSAFSLLSSSTFEVDGRGSILSRPMNMVVDALEQFGKNVESNNGKLPLKIDGQTRTNEITIDGSTSSQLLTGLLTVAPFLPFDLKINVKDLKSIPYIEMTMDLMDHFGLSVQHENFESFLITGNQKVNGQIEYTVEGDWSGASFLIVAGLIGGTIRLKGLNKNSLQADRAMLTVVDKVGGNYNWEDNDLWIEGGGLNSFEFDATHCPDLFPPLVALASMIKGRSEIRGVHRLKHKESDRASALIEEFNKLGISVVRENDSLFVNGLDDNQKIEGAIVDAHGDHRMAMCLTLMSLRSKSNIVVNGPESIKKSYPLFFEDFDKVSLS